ncbi:catalytic protein [Spatholobus suberectus]|nr:catalytic protein [Spatholobus suberectus]
MSGSRFLFSNGILLRTSDAPPVKGFLVTHPATLPIWQPTVQMLVNDSMCKVLPIALKERNDGEELAITTLVSGNLEELNACETVIEERMSKILDVHVHIETYVPPTFGIRGNGVHLAVVGYGRHVAAAKYSDWVRIRKPLEKLRPPSVTELLLSNDGDQILEGCVTNFFVVCCKDWDSNDGKPLCDYGNKYSFEVQTAPISDGVLPGTIRQLVLEVCRVKEFHFEKLLHHGQNMKSGRRHSSQIA